MEYIFIIYLNYVQRTSTDLIKENGFIFKKKKRRYTIETRTDYVDDQSRGSARSNGL